MHDAQARVEFRLEHTLGFVNESYAPDLDRNGGHG